MIRVRKPIIFMGPLSAVGRSWKRVTHLHLFLYWMCSTTSVTIVTTRLLTKNLFTYPMPSHFPFHKLYQQHCLNETMNSSIRSPVQTQMFSLQHPSTSQKTFFSTRNVLVLQCRTVCAGGAQGWGSASSILDPPHTQAHTPHIVFMARNIYATTCAKIGARSIAVLHKQLSNG